MADNVVHNSLHHDAHLQAPLPTPGDKSEPPSEWASSTINALGPVDSAPHSTDKGITESNPHETSTYPSSTATTPGYELPGAFPRGQGYNQSGIMAGDTQYVKDAAANALEAAKGYVAIAGEKVGGYLPGSVAAYLPTSQSQHTDTNGVDSGFPKTNSEVLASIGADTSPAPPILDRKAEDNTLAHPEYKSESETLRDSDADADSKNGATFETPLRDSPDASTRSIAGSRVDSWSHTATPGANSMLTDPSSNGSTVSNMRNADGTMKTSSSASMEAQASPSNQPLPSNHHTSHLGNPNMERPDLEHHGEETRNIPSDSSLPDTATTPDAKSASTVRHGAPPMTTGREYPISSAEDNKLREGARPDTLKGFQHDSVASNVATPGHGPMPTEEKEKKKDTEVGVLPSTHAVDKAGHSTTQKSKSSSSAGATATTTDNSKDDTPKAALQAGDDAPIGIGPTPPSHANLKADDNANSKSKPKTKSGFMDKVRGEIKVLSGKVAHDQEKVEEGRKMMGKATTPTKN